MKTFAENLRNARIEHGLSQEQLAKLIGVKSGSVIYNWESCTSRPDIDKIFKICEVLQISANYLFNTSDDYPSTEEMSVIKKYRTLDTFGRDAVDSIIKIEYDRVMAAVPKKKKTRMLKINFYSDPASAGTGNFLDETVPDEIWVKETEEAERADYIIGVSGDSMEPSYHNGSRVFVEHTEDIRIGEIGIFSVNGEVYIKELGDNCLISHNEKYRPIRLGASDSVYCCGRVVGIVEEKT